VTTTVHLVAGPTHLTTPAGVERHDVTTAVEMRKAVVDLAGEADVVVKAAAVADFRPAAAAEHKIKKHAGIPTIELERNPDILAELGTRKAESGATRPLLVGFAAETDDPEGYGRVKLERKNADLLVVNDVSAHDAGFEVDTNQVVILTRDGARIEVALSTKDDVAARLLDEVVTRLG
jgi:phosphopantothenoylcysteine decarboxylase/phosphopantothenate--cysteine ligase